MELNFILNGKKVSTIIEADSLLLDVVRDLGCLSVKRGCDTSNCGLCTVFVNDKPAKASVSVKVGDIIEIQFGTRNVKVEVTTVAETVKKEEAKEMYREL